MKNPYQVNKNGNRISTLIKRSTGKQFTSWPLTAQRAQNLHRRLSTNSFLHKLGFTDSEKCTFCRNETEHLLHLFWTCEKTQSFWNSLISWLQSGRIIEKDSRSLEADAALGLRSDNSKYELQINFCFLIAKYFIWICKLKECTPKLSDFLSYLRHFFKIENDGRTVAKKWQPLLPILQ